MDIFLILFGVVMGVVLIYFNIRNNVIHKWYKELINEYFSFFESHANTHPEVVARFTGKFQYYHMSYDTAVLKKFWMWRKYEMCTGDFRVDFYETVEYLEKAKVENNG
jgi:cell shape-determining protein MreC